MELSTSEYLHAHTGTVKSNQQSGINWPNSSKNTGHYPTIFPQSPNKMLTKWRLLQLFFRSRLFLAGFILTANCKLEGQQSTVGICKIAGDDAGSRPILNVAIPSSQNKECCFERDNRLIIIEGTFYYCPHSRNT